MTTTTNTQDWNKASITNLIETNDVAAMRAVCAIFRRQTQDERTDETTRHNNGVGFSQAHAKIGSELALWMTGGENDGVMRRRTGGRFAGKWTCTGTRSNGSNIWAKNASKFAGRDRLAVCREIAKRYTRQLIEIANA